MENKTEKEELGEIIINDRVSRFMKDILKIEEASEGDLYFDDLKVEADLKDGRILTIILRKL